MVGLRIRFLAGRFHATPWGRHANEAQPEWPPSPWRLLRALVATWKTKLDDDPRCAGGRAEAVLKALAVPPAFRLPPATLGHFRCYQPWFKKGPDDRTLVFDGFVAVEKERELDVVWRDVTLPAEHLTALDAMATNMGFLGRAESWVEVKVMTAEELAIAEPKLNCRPARSEGADLTQEPVRLLCPEPAGAFSNEHTPRASRTEGKGKSKQLIVTSLYDPDWHLCMETQALHDDGWSEPPGSRWLPYLRPRDCFAAKARRRSVPPATSRPSVARFALDAQVLPLVEDTILVAEAARRTAMGVYRRIEERRLYRGPAPEDAPLPRSEVFAGKDAEGQPLAGHRHTYYLPTDEDGDGHVDHLTLVAELGFGTGEVAALDAMRRLRVGESEVGVLLLGVAGRGELTVPTVFGPSQTWSSATPFVSTRHPKHNGRRRDAPGLLGPDNARAFAEQVLREELDRLRETRPDVPVPSIIAPLNPEHRIGNPPRLRPIQFRRFRSKSSDDGGRRAAGAFRIVFPEPVRGPLCLGHSSHFGLGLFLPEL